ncbi:MAG TPA: hypothetical protein VF021_11470 [Longimicrobiales bacterium]
MTPLAILVSAFAGCFVGSLVPLVNTEVVVLAAAAAAPRSLLIPLVLVAAGTQMLAKALLYAAGAGLLRLPAGRLSRRLQPAVERASQLKGTSNTVLFVSATTGLPPFYLMSIAAGVLHLKFRKFMVIGFIGRVLRFSAVIAAPQLLHTIFSTGDTVLSLTAVAVGLIAGAHTATWGMYKDALHERFTWKKYSRSILVSGLLAPVIAALAGLNLRDIAHVVVLFGATYVLERAVTEFYKTFVRNEDQSKYFIPMQFAVRGRVVRSRARRLLIGVAVAGLVIALMWGMSTLQHAISAVPLALATLLGGLGGWLSALGGAWKDAPVEGFELPKFFRSPVFATLYAALLWSFTHNLVLTGLAALGFTVATLETYKTFFFPSVPRGKFAGKPILFPQMMQRRYWFVPLYTGIWLLVIVSLLGAVWGELPQFALR